jgi:hypothetical protein
MIALNLVREKAAKNRTALSGFICQHLIPFRFADFVSPVFFHNRVDRWALIYKDLCSQLEGFRRD